MYAVVVDACPGVQVRRKRLRSCLCVDKALLDRLQNWNRRACVRSALTSAVLGSGRKRGWGFEPATAFRFYIVFPSPRPPAVFLLLHGRYLLGNL